MNSPSFLDEHFELTRRFFLQASVLGLATTPLVGLALADDPKPAQPPQRDKPDKAGVRSEPYFTPSVDFRDVSRGKPLPHSLPEEKKSEVGLTRDTWQLEVLSDPDHPAKLGKQFTKADGTAFNFAALLQLGERHAVRFPKVMTCLNLGCPLGMGLWEGVPLREVVWLTRRRFSRGWVSRARICGGSFTMGIITTNRRRCFGVRSRWGACWRIRSACRR